MYYICNVGIIKDDDIYTLRYLDAPITITGSNLEEMVSLFLSGVEDYLYENEELIDNPSIVLNLLPNESCIQIPLYIERDEYYEF